MQKPEIIWPSREKIKELDPYIKKILAAIGVKSAFVSDKSMLYDFEPLWYDFRGKLTDAEKDTAVNNALCKIAEELGLDKVSGHDYIWQIAERCKENKNV